MFDKDAKDDGKRKEASTTIIGQGTRIKGEITAESGLRLDGAFEGTMVVAETLTVGETGEVTGEISVKNASLGGKVRGNLTATEAVVLEARAELHGDLRTKRLVINEGAILNGHCLMNEPAASQP